MRVREVKPILNLNLNLNLISPANERIWSSRITSGVAVLVVAVAALLVAASVE